MPGARHCLLFDLDGVLIDSWDVARSAFVGACAEIGRDGEELVSGFRDRLGRPIEDIARQLDLPAGFGETFRTHARRLDHLAVPLDGVAELLAGLRSLGCLIGVVTGKDRARSLSVLASCGLLAHVDALVAGDEGPGKPAPDPLLLCLDRLGAPLCHGFVGDTATDMEAARQARVPAILALWGGARPVACDLLLSRPRDVADLIGMAQTS